MPQRDLHANVELVEVEARADGGPWESVGTFPGGQDVTFPSRWQHTVVVEVRVRPVGRMPETFGGGPWPWVPVAFWPRGERTAEVHAGQEIASPTRFTLADGSR
jgi:hypothetical protein